MPGVRRTICSGAHRTGGKGPLLEVFRYDVNDPTSFTLPRVGGRTVDLMPESTYRSPYLNGKFGEDHIAVTVGPIEQVYDFENNTVTEAN